MVSSGPKSRPGSENPLPPQGGYPPQYPQGPPPHVHPQQQQQQWEAQQQMRGGNYGPPPPQQMMPPRQGGGQPMQHQQRGRLPPENAYRGGNGGAGSGAGASGAGGPPMLGMGGGPQRMVKSKPSSSSLSSRDGSAGPSASRAQRPTGPGGVPGNGSSSSNNPNSVRPSRPSNRDGGSSASGRHHGEHGSRGGGHHSSSHGGSSSRNHHESANPEPPVELDDDFPEAVEDFLAMCSDEELEREPHLRQYVEILLARWARRTARRYPVADSFAAAAVGARRLLAHLGLKPTPCSQRIERGLARTLAVLAVEAAVLAYQEAVKSGNEANLIEVPPYAKSAEGEEREAAIEKLAGDYLARAEIWTPATAAKASQQRRRRKRRSRFLSVFMSAEAQKQQQEQMQLLGLEKGQDESSANVSSSQTTEHVQSLNRRKASLDPTATSRASLDNPTETDSTTHNDSNSTTSAAAPSSSATATTPTTPTNHLPTSPSTASLSSLVEGGGLVEGIRAPRSGQRRPRLSVVRRSVSESRLGERFAAAFMDENDVSGGETSPSPIVSPLRRSNTRTDRDRNSPISPAGAGGAGVDA
ncbi:hypothetical protein HK102_008005 [Quaeritorhiza haematococci]|nr:hypothetical protein HK102_008005 [Quaeritorhiza haematococci]